MIALSFFDALLYSTYAVILLNLFFLSHLQFVYVHFIQNDSVCWSNVKFISVWMSNIYCTVVIDNHIILVKQEKNQNFLQITHLPQSKTE